VRSITCIDLTYAGVMGHFAGRVTQSMSAIAYGDYDPAVPGLGIARIADFGALPGVV